MNPRMLALIAKATINPDNELCVCGKAIDPKDHWFWGGQRWCSAECVGKMTPIQEEEFIACLKDEDALVKEDQ